jgi:GSH-dependent disulfide-bond oxidoreductase
MYDLYVFTTPNCWKTTILAEELGEPYECKAVVLPKHENTKDEFRKLSPLGKVPAIYDHDTKGSVYGSAAILVYLADKYGKFIPPIAKARERGEALDWAMFGLTDLGVAFNTWNKFANRLPTKDQFAIDESWSEVARFMKTADERLAKNEYLAGKDYSIADMSVFPFVGGARKNPKLLEEHRNLARWVAQVESRPAVKKGIALPKL